MERCKDHDDLRQDIREVKVMLREIRDWQQQQVGAQKADKKWTTIISVLVSMGTSLIVKKAG